MEPPDGRDWKAGGGEGSRNAPPETAFSRERPPCRAIHKIKSWWIKELAFKKNGKFIYN